MTLAYTIEHAEYRHTFADVATMSYGGSVNSASGQPFPTVRGLPTYHGRSVATLNTADALLARVDELTRLPQNWDTYGACAPSAEAAGRAKRATELADGLGITPTAIVPSAESGIGVVFRRGTRYADLEIFNSGEILAVTSDGGGAPRVWEVRPSEAAVVEALKAIRDYLW